MTDYDSNYDSLTKRKLPSASSSRPDGLRSCRLFLTNRPRSYATPGDASLRPIRANVIARRGYYRRLPAVCPQNYPPPPPLRRPATRTCARNRRRQAPATTHHTQKRRRSVRLKRTDLRVRGLSLNRSQQYTALLRTTPRLRTRSSTNDLAPLRRM